jgi:hypothetical protein
MLTSLRRHRSATAVAVVTASLIGLTGALTLGVSAPAFAADKGQVSLEPVSFDGTTYTGTDAKGPFTALFPKGLNKNDPNSATAELDDNFKPGTTYPWGSVGAKNGSFILNNTGKNMCKIVVTATDGNTFITAPKSGVNWNVAVSADKKTLTFTAAKNPDNCIKNGSWFWMLVPKSPQPGSGDTPTLEGSFASLAPDPTGETGVVELTANDAFASTLYDIDEAIAGETASPTPSGTAVATTTPTDFPTSSPSATATDLPTGSPSATITDSPTAPATTLPAPPTTPADPVTTGAGQ